MLSLIYVILLITIINKIFLVLYKTVNEVYYAGEYTLNGTGEYEGWLILRKRFTLEHRNNGYWKCIELEDVVIPI